MYLSVSHFLPHTAGLQRYKVNKVKNFSIIKREERSFLCLSIPLSKVLHVIATLIVIIVFFCELVVIDLVLCCALFLWCFVCEAELVRCLISSTTTQGCLGNLHRLTDDYQGQFFYFVFSFRIFCFFVHCLSLSCPSR